MTRLTLALAAATLAACASKKAEEFSVLGAEPLSDVAVTGRDVRADTVAQPGLERAAPPGGALGAPLPPRPRVGVRLGALPNPSIGQLREVEVEVTVDGAAGPVELALEFHAPGGVVFDRQVRTLEGTAFDAHLERFVLPVAGTLIDQNALAGEWQAKVFLAGRQLDAQSFGLTP